MAGIAAGLMVFGAGQAISAALLSFSKPTWASTIVDNVKMLLSIAADEKSAGLVAGFPNVMKNIAKGLVEYTLGVGKSNVIKFFTGGDSGSAQIASEAKQLMSIMADPNITASKSEEFKIAMQNISAGMTAMAGGGFKKSLAGLGSAVLNFLTPGKKKKGVFEEVAELGKQSKEIDAASNAMIKLAGALARISDLKFDGSKLNFKKFAEDLAMGVPAIESAIMGGKIEGGWFKSDVSYKGLASDDIDVEKASERIILLRKALGAFDQGGGVRADAEKRLKERAIEDEGNRMPASMNVNANPVNIQKGGDTSVVQGTINSRIQVRQGSSVRGNPYKYQGRGAGYLRGR